MKSFLSVLSLFRDITPFSVTILLPGVVAMLCYPALLIYMGREHESEAFVTAFALALATRAAPRMNTVLTRVLAAFSPRDVVLFLLPAALGPLMLLMWLDDPLWCQRMQSLYHIVLGSMFLSDVLGRRQDMAALFWPWPEMKPTPTSSRFLR